MRTRCDKWEKRDGIVDVRELGFESDAGAVLVPLGPGGTVQFGINGRDSGCHSFSDSTVVSAHLISDVRGACRHDFFCGYLALKKVSNLRVNAWRMREASSARRLSGLGT